MDLVKVILQKLGGIKDNHIHLVEVVAPYDMEAKLVEIQVQQIMVLLEKV